MFSASLDIAAYDSALPPWPPKSASIKATVPFFGDELLEYLLYLVSFYRARGQSAPSNRGTMVQNIRVRRASRARK